MPYLIPYLGYENESISYDLQPYLFKASERTN